MEQVTFTQNLIGTRKVLQKVNALNMTRQSQDTTKHKNITRHLLVNCIYTSKCVYVQNIKRKIAY